MALKDTWEDLEDKVQGDPDSGSEISVKPINDIAHAVMDLEENEDVVTNTAPYIGDNGNWYEWNDIQRGYVDTGVKAKGADGYTPLWGVDYFDGEDGYTPQKGFDYWTDSDKEEIKADVVETLTRSSTALPEMLDVNTIYDLGEQDALTLNLPSGKLGDFIEVDFLSTQTPTTLTITASAGMSDYELIPDANTIYSLYFNWIRLDVETYGWGFGYAEYTRTVTE